MALTFGTNCLKTSGMITTFRDVVALWPSPDALAAEIGAGTAAVRKWPQRDNIPAEWWLPILKTGKAQKAGLTADALAGLASRERAEARA